MYTKNINIAIITIFLTKSIKNVKDFNMNVKITNGVVFKLFGEY